VPAKRNKATGNESIPVAESQKQPPARYARGLMEIDLPFRLGFRSKGSTAAARAIPQRGQKTDGVLASKPKEALLTAYIHPDIASVAHCAGCSFRRIGALSGGVEE